MHLLSDLMKGKYVVLKRTAEDRKEWQKLVRAGSQTHTPGSLHYLSELSNIIIDIRRWIYKCIMWCYGCGSFLLLCSPIPLLKRTRRHCFSERGASKFEEVPLDEQSELYEWPARWALALSGNPPLYLAKKFSHSQIRSCRHRCRSSGDVAILTHKKRNSKYRVGHSRAYPLLNYWGVSPIPISWCMLLSTIRLQRRRPWIGIHQGSFAMKKVGPMEYG